jgi:hypothetical protein
MRATDPTTNQRLSETIQVMLVSGDYGINQSEPSISQQDNQTSVCVSIPDSLVKCIQIKSEYIIESEQDSKNRELGNKGKLLSEWIFFFWEIVFHTPPPFTIT